MRCRAVLFAVPLGLALSAPAVAAEPLYARDGVFDSKTVEKLARDLSQAPFAPPKDPLPPSLSNLDYDQYRDIRFRPGEAIWAGAGLGFQVQMFSRGFFFTDPVEIAIVDGGHAHHVAYRPELFSTGKVMTAALPTNDIGFSGFRLHYPINRRNYADEIAVFQGASYFRSLGRNQVYGLSSRGLALKFAAPEGEEFPVFRAFWVHTPAPRSATIVVDALLDSASVAGAYRFTIHPGEATVMEVEAVLFPRKELTKVGLTPATSMFMFSFNDREGVDDFRPQVHDSDGLLMINGRGEHLWRPLANPTKLQVSAFLDHDPRGFGLLQRDRAAEDYQDFEAHYEARPSLWIEPSGHWGDGSVLLVEIPSDKEIHDNILATWAPKAPIPAGSEYRFAYRLRWGGEPNPSEPIARIVATRRGRGNLPGANPGTLFVIDYSSVPGAPHASSHPPQVHASTSAGELKDVVIRDNPLTGGWRVSFELDPKGADLAELRVDLDFGGGHRAETWLERWIAN